MRHRNESIIHLCRRGGFFAQALFKVVHFINQQLHLLANPVGFCRPVVDFFVGSMSKVSRCSRDVSD